MRYAYNESIGGLVNGVIFFFEPGDDLIAESTFDFLVGKKDEPTSIVWAGRPVTLREAVSLINAPRALCETVGIRFTIEKEENLLSEYLMNLAENYLPLAELAAEIRRNVLPPAFEFLN